MGNPILISQNNQYSWIQDPGDQDHGSRIPPMPHTPLSNTTRHTSTQLSLCHGDTHYQPNDTPNPRNPAQKHLNRHSRTTTTGMPERHCMQATNTTTNETPARPTNHPHTHRPDRPLLHSTISPLDTHTKPPHSTTTHHTSQHCRTRLPAQPTQLLRVL
jgi:hypothetical protein